MLERIVAEVFRSQVLTREMQGKLQRLLAGDVEISQGEYEALARLRGAILDGAVQVVTRRQFRNVMEELVWEELTARGLDPEHLGESTHEIVAYALNRLPPLLRDQRGGSGVPAQPRPG